MTVVESLDLAALRWVRAAALDGTARRIRVDARISIPELAEEVGVSSASISRWETGLRRPRGEPARRYAAALLALQSADGGP